MKISIIGIRGIPVIYSGFESFAENLATSLVKKNFRVYVYCRLPYVNVKRKQYKKVNLISLPTIRSKNLESFIHSFLSTIHTIIFIRPQIIYYLGVGNALFTFIPRLFGARTFINVDGLDWRREKWGKIASFYLRISEYLATILPSVTVTDSLYMKNYYLTHYGKKTIYIPYGFDKKLLTIGRGIEDKVLKQYNIKKNKYFVWVGRIVPDNHLEELIYAFRKLKTNYKCVVIGDDIYKSSYKRFIFDLAKENKRIVFTGFLSKDRYALLVRNALCYVETKRSGGTHPSLIEAIGMTKTIIANDNKSNRGILKTSGFFYSPKNFSNLSNILKLLKDSYWLNKNSKTVKKRLKEIIKNEYYFSEILQKYLKLFK